MYTCIHTCVYLFVNVFDYLLGTKKSTVTTYPPSKRKTVNDRIVKARVVMFISFLPGSEFYPPFEGQSDVRCMKPDRPSSC